MAAYGAAASLKNTIQSILQSSRISLVPPSSQIIQPAYEAMVHLQKVLLKLEETGYSKIRTKVNALDDRIKEVLWEFEDLLESHFTHQTLPQLESERDHLSFSLDLQCLRQSVDCFVERVAEMEAEYDIELMNMPEEEGKPLSSRMDYGGINSNMVGLSDEFEQVRDLLLAEDEGWVSIVGMAGVGKTAFAKKVFDDPWIQTHFELQAWVKVGRKCEYSEIVRCILAQVDPNTYDQLVALGDDYDEVLVVFLEDRLKNKKCLLVLDDVWEWDTQLMDIFPEENVRILLTSRLRIQELKNLASEGTIHLLNEEESIKLLGEKLFGEKGFPPDLEELGKKIANKCEGLPLMIVTVAELLSKEDKTTQCWTEVAEKQHNAVFMAAYDQISEVLYPSYDYLPQYLKLVFLYLGAFPPYTDIETDFLYDRLIAEGFLEQNLDDFILNAMGELDVRYHLVQDERNPKSWFSTNKHRVHSCWQHLCKKEASNIKFLHVLQTCGDDVIKDQRRLCAHSNMLFAFKEVYDSINNDCATTTRSLLCYGPYHQYPVPIQAMNFKLLRVLDALKVRFYHFPLNILKLVCLKYLALSYTKELPVNISNLFHLQFLIIYPHMHIKVCGVSSYMPLEIWNMRELQLISVMGRDLPTPNPDATLDKLLTLFGVSAMSCTKEILKRIPNLERLRILMELKPFDDDDDDDYSNALSGLGHISTELQNLNVLSYSIQNPDMKHESMVPLTMFPSSLTVLILKGLGCPWKHMNDIGSQLPNLKRLVLEHYAFQGPDWDIDSGCFLKLEKLVIEDTDLVRWRAQYGSLPRLYLLSIRHCYKLKQLDWTRHPSMVTRPTIELVDCNPLVVLSGVVYNCRVHCATSL